MRSSVLLGSAAILLLTSTAWAGAYAPLPSADKQASGLQVRVVRYTGGTNGEMLVEVKNPTARPVSFSAEGLYFIPEGDPEKAPQRLGAAGPFLVQREGTWKSAQALPLAARTAARLRLQVFCIDSHRASPTAQHAFRLAAQRLPKALRAEIEGGAKRALGQYRAMPAAKSAIQSNVWQARDRAWIKLDGERAEEKSSLPRGQRRLQRRYLHVEPQPMQQAR